MGFFIVFQIILLYEEIILSETFQKKKHFSWTRYGFVFVDEQKYMAGGIFSGVWLLNW